LNGSWQPLRRGASRFGRREEGPRVTERRDHYSYTTYASSRTAQQFDDRRFGGPIGRLVAHTQASVLTNFVGNVRGRLILDHGTGTRRPGRLFGRRGAAVTALHASAQIRRDRPQRASTRLTRAPFRRRHP